MCGRYVATKDADGLLRMFVVDDRDPHARAGRPPGNHVRWVGTPNYNVAPTDRVPAVVRHEGETLLTGFRWGLVPFWAKDPKIGARMINARSESVHEKKAFAESFARRRCLIPADGFYEWQKVEGQRLPWFVRRTDGEPMAFAGIWASWRERSSSDSQQLLTCSILTTDANTVLSGVHDRMPVILERSQWDEWLDPQSDPPDLQGLLAPAPNDDVERYRVSTRVNSVANNDPDLVNPLDEETEGRLVEPVGQPTLFD